MSSIWWRWRGEPIGWSGAGEPIDANRIKSW
jgi:hypothetical protein